MASIAVSADFYSSFQTLKSEILSNLTSTAPNIPLVSKLLISLKTEFRTKLTEGSLPPYDQRRYDAQIKELEGKIGDARAAAVAAETSQGGLDKGRAIGKGKGRFAFRAGAGAASPSVSSAGPSAPNDLGTAPTLDSQAGTSGSSVLPRLKLGSEAGSAMIPSTSSSSSSSSYNVTDISNQRITLDGLPSYAHNTSSPSPPADASAEASCAHRDYVLSLANLSECVVDLRPIRNSATSSATSDTRENSQEWRLTALHAKSLDRCILILPLPRPPLSNGPQGSLFLVGVTNSILCLSGQQFRMHDSSRCKILLQIGSLPIIETCHDLQFGPYRAMPDTPTQMTASETHTPSLATPEPEIPPVPFQNYHDQIQDFSWVRGGQSPNWRIMSDSQREKVVQVVNTAELETKAETGSILDSILQTTND